MNELDLAEICDQMDLGRPRGMTERVFGGLIHKIWRIETEKGVFAIKELSKHIKFDDDIKKSYERSEEIARDFQKAGIPAVATLAKNGNALVELNTGHLLCFPWVNGTPLAINEPTKKHLVKMAKALAEIHKASLRLFGWQRPKYRFTSSSMLADLLAEAKQNPAPFQAEITKHESLLIEINQRSHAAIPMLENTGLISHTDSKKRFVGSFGKALYYRLGIGTGNQSHSRYYSGGFGLDRKSFLLDRYTGFSTDVANI